MYEITIRKTEIRETIAGKNWKVIGEEFIYEDGVEGKDDKKVDVYGYTPEITKKQEVEYEIYKQCVEKLDLPSVIRAINGMDKL